MGKNIVFFADGTWQVLDQKTPTNVAKMYSAASNGPGQVTQYDPGVGTDGNPIDWLAGGVSGAGLLDKIKDGYKYIAGNYQPGDQISIFGFSRGAYTARSLAGMIAVCGLPDHDQVTNQSVSDAFVAYRTRTNRDHLLDTLKQKYGNNTYNIEIVMVGVWDTVGALGIPESLFATLDSALYGFLDTNLHQDIKAACHALAIDENRQEFAPTLWQPNGTSALAQVWFPGGHSDVGGGLPSDELSKIALKWMVLQAKRYGVQFNPQNFSDITGVPFNPAKATVTLTKCLAPPKLRNVPTDAVLANDVGMMVGNDPPPYHPANLLYQPDGTLSAGYGTQDVV
jgi:uncharacterized protein (DUF2235 family)